MGHARTEGADGLRLTDGLSALTGRDWHGLPILRCGEILNGSGSKNGAVLIKKKKGKGEKRKKGRRKGRKKGEKRRKKEERRGRKREKKKGKKGRREERRREKEGEREKEECIERRRVRKEKRRDGAYLD